MVGFAGRTNGGAKPCSLSPDLDVVLPRIGMLLQQHPSQYAERYLHRYCMPVTSGQRASEIGSSDPDISHAIMPIVEWHVDLGALM